MSATKRKDKGRELEEKRSKKDCQGVVSENRIIGAIDYFDTGLTIIEIGTGLK